MDYIIHILIFIGIYAILGISMNLLVGFTGLLSLAHAAFYGVGAYVAALMALKVQTPFWLNLILAVVAAGVIGALLALPSLRVKDDYFAIATFAFQVIVFSVLNNLVDFTGGPMGLPGIPAVTVFGWEFSENWHYLVLVVLLAALTYFVARRIVTSPFGRVLKAIREDEVFARAFGKDIAAFKVKVFVAGASMAAVAGVMYAHYISFIDPTSFTIMESIFIISIVIIGGAGNIRGSIIGAVVLVSIPEALRFLGLPTALAANVRQILYGLLLVVFMVWRPQGFVGEYSFQRESEE